jgi:hypothetical protein
MESKLAHHALIGATENLAKLELVSAVPASAGQASRLSAAVSAVIRYRNAAVP